MTHNFAWLNEAARLLKCKLDVPIIFGGVHVTSCPDFVISKYEHIDYIIPGEADAALPLFCDYIEGKVPIENVPESGSTRHWINIFFRVNADTPGECLVNKINLGESDRIFLHKASNLTI